ncbi:MAG: UDP-N-acetylmuramate dehydrogenase [Candidatus Hydrogenedentota bacterium]|nr:MAG: UDP-N-acetylmuramate dehydrogenase [Candidatus Hydrogenedentota bacterium]
MTAAKQRDRLVENIRQMYNELCEEIGKLMRGKLKKDEPMSGHTSLRIGGPADIWAVPRTLKDLFALLDLCERSEFPYMILGHGTNLLVRDGGIRGVVISLNDACASLDPNKGQIAAGAGVSLNALVKFAAQRGLQGLEFFIGIPGCVGGGLVANAGAWGKSLGDAVKSVAIYDPKKRQIKRLEKDEIKFGYRESNLASFGVILEAEFAVKEDEPEAIFARMKEYLARRADSQPVGFKSAGCIFKNPPVSPAGQLIDALGFKGYICGGAMVSDIHANFIVNTGFATAADVLAIMAEIKGRVRSATGIDLEEEIEVVGKD